MDKLTVLLPLKRNDCCLSPIFSPHLSFIYALFSVVDTDLTHAYMDDIIVERGMLKGLFIES